MVLLLFGKGSLPVFQLVFSHVQLCFSFPFSPPKRSFFSGGVVVTYRAGHIKFGMAKRLTTLPVANPSDTNGALIHVECISVLVTIAALPGFIELSFPSWILIGLVCRSGFPMVVNGLAGM